MIEKMIYDFLNKKLEVPAYMMEPKSPPDSYVLIDRTAGDDEHVKTATIAIQSYGKSLIEACKLNEKVKEVMRDIIDLDDIAKCKLNSDYNFTDTETKRYRYQAVFNLIYYK